MCNLLSKRITSGTQVRCVLFSNALQTKIYQRTRYRTNSFYDDEPASRRRGVLSCCLGYRNLPWILFRDFKAQIPNDVTFACQNSARVVCLDYFYLPAHYYAENYGTNWVSHKIPNLLHNPNHPNRVECVILPYDRLGEARTVEPKGSLKEQIENAKLSEDSYFDLSWKEAAELHPLVKASQDVGLVASGTNKPLNQSACESYLIQIALLRCFINQMKREVLSDAQEDDVSELALYTHTIKTQSDIDLKDDSTRVTEKIQCRFRFHLPVK